MERIRHWLAMWRWWWRQPLYVTFDDPRNWRIATGRWIDRMPQRKEARPPK
jgi:hypothetical protein